MSELEKTTEIYAPVWGTHLGDCISSLNYLVHESHKINKCIRVSDHYVKVDQNNNIIKRKTCHNLYEVEKLILEKDRFIIVKDDPTIRSYDRTNFGDINRNKKFLTNKYQFNEKNIESNIVAYQFDPRGPTRGRGFSSKEIENTVLKELKNMGFELIKIGAPLTLEQCSQVLAKAEMVVCIMSGIAWLAATTKTPAFIVGNSFGKELCLSHIGGYQTFIFSQDYLELIENIKKYKEDRQFYNKNCYKVKYE